MFPVSTLNGYNFYAASDMKWNAFRHMHPQDIVKQHCTCMYNETITSAHVHIRLLVVVSAEPVLLPLEHSLGWQVSVHSQQIFTGDPGILHLLHAKTLTHSGPKIFLPSYKVFFNTAARSGKEGEREGEKY